MLVFSLSQQDEIYRHGWARIFLYHIVYIYRFHLMRKSFAEAKVDLPRLEVVSRSNETADLEGLIAACSEGLQRTSLRYCRTDGS